MVHFLSRKGTKERGFAMFMRDELDCRHHSWVYSTHLRIASGWV